jgi:hypothetical protein
VGQQEKKKDCFCIFLIDFLLILKGRGVYTSPDPNFANNYSKDGKLIVVAVLLGNARVYEGGPLQRGFHSHISNNGKEFVSFDASCVLPLFLLDYHSSQFEGGVSYLQTMQNALQQMASLLPGYNSQRQPKVALPSVLQRRFYKKKKK